jgi:ABC-2 type transport system permease protein
MNNRITSHQLFRLTSAYFLELIREPGVIFWGIVFPILMALGLGIAFTKKPDMTRTVAVIGGVESQTQHLPVLHGILNRNGFQLSRMDGPTEKYSFSIENEKIGKTTYILIPTTLENALQLLKRGNINLILEEVDEDIIYHFDPSNPEAQLVYLQLSKILKSGFSINEQVAENIEPMTVTGTRYIDFLIPGLMAMGIMMSCMWGISYGIIDKRTKKLLRRMIATPMKKHHFLIALITVRLGMNFVEAALLFIFALLFFHISIQGDVSALTAVFISGNICFSGIAIFTSSRTANTEVGNGLINAVVLPMVVLSGIFFSYHNFPNWSIPVIQKLPLTMLADGMRSIFIEGAGWPETVFISTTMSLIGVVFFSTGLKIFRWY